MNPEKVNQLYNFLADNGVEDIGTDMSFMARMQNPKDRKMLYDFLDDNKVEGIGTTFTEFEQILGVDEAPSAKMPSFEDFKEATVAQSRQSVEGRLAEARESLSRTTATDFATEKLFKPHTDIVQEERDYVLRPSEKVMENIDTKKLENIGKEEYKYLKGQRDISIHNMDNLIAEAKKIQRQMFEKGGGSVKGVNSITGAQITLPSKEAVKIGNLITILEDTRDKYDKMVTKADKEHGKKGGFVAGLGEIDLLNVLTAGWADVFKNIDPAVAIHKASYGGKLTPEEQLYLKMFEEQARLDGIIEAEGGTTRGYNIGSGLAESLPFITSMLTTGGVASAVKGGVTKGLGAIGREAAKEGAEKSLKNIASRAVNGVVGSAAATAATIPLQAGVYNNYIDNAFNEYTTYGRLTDSPIQRMWKSYADAFTDVFTENLGGIISGAAKYMLNGVGAKTAFGRLFGTVGRRIQPFYQDILKRTAFNGFVGEFEEEMLANFLSPLMRGDSKEERNAAWKEAFGKESIVTTLATTALMSAGFGAGKVVSAADATRKYEKFKTKARNALANIEDRRLEQQLVDIMALPTLQERCQAFANMNWQGDYKSMGHGVDYFYNSILKEVYDGVVKMEDANEVVMPTLRTLDTVVERGTSDVVTAQMDGKPVYIIRGVGDNAESAIVQDMEGNRQQVAMSSLQEVNVTPVSEVVADLINKEYNAISAEMDAQEQAEEDATLRERGLVPPSDRAKADQFEPEEVVMVNGKTATINSIDKASGTARVDIEGEEANQQVKIADMQKITPEQISSEVEAQQINQPALTQDGEIDIVTMGEEQTANYISEKADASYVEDMLADRRKKLKTAQKGIRLPLNLTERQKAIEQRNADIARLEQEISMWEGVKNRLTQPQPTSEVAQETADVAEVQEVALQEVSPEQVVEQTTEEVVSNATSLDKQGNPIDKDGNLLVDVVESIDDITDEDFNNPTRSIQLPALPNNVDEAIGADGKPVVIKKNIFERNAVSHSDLTPEQSRQILKSALYSPKLYGQNQKRRKPYNWVVISVQDESAPNKLVLLEINEGKDNVEIVHWHYIDQRGLEKLKRQAEREDGQLLILPSEVSEEVGALADPTLNQPSTDKNTTSVPENQTSEQKNVTEEEKTTEQTPEKEVEDTAEDIHTREQVDALEWKAGVVMNEEARNHKTTKALDDMAKAAGVRVAFVDSIVEDGIEANGLYDPRTKTIYIASDRLKGANFVAGHEMLHHIKTLSPQAYKEYMEAVKAEVGAERFEKAKEGLRQTYRIAILGSLKKSGIVTDGTSKEERETLIEREMPSDEVLTEEVVADWTGSLIGYSGGFSDFVKRYKGGVVLRVLRNAVEHIGTFFKGRNSWERTMQRRLKALDTLLDESMGEVKQSKEVKKLTKAMTPSKEVVKVAETIPNTQGAESKMSLMIAPTLEAQSAEYFNRYYQGKNASARFRPVSKVMSEDALKVGNDAISAMVEIMAPHIDDVVFGKRLLPEEVYGKGYTTIFKNGSYGRSMENTTNCVRTLAYNEFTDEVKKQIGRPLTTAESFLASQMLYDIAKDPQCLYCYVSLDRKAYDEFLLRYLRERDVMLKQYAEMEEKTPEAIDALYNIYLNGRKDTKPMRERFEKLISIVDNGSTLISGYDLMTREKRNEMRETSEDIRWQIEDAEKYAQGASWAKKEEEYRAYAGEILKMPFSIVKQLSEEYGLRFYSFSEYTPAFIVENMQMVRDAALRGLRGFAYTKEVDFVKIFAPTGMNMNVSTFGRVDSEGNVVPDERQGASWEAVKALREQYPNVGATFVATDDKMVEWALAQDWIDVVIPFHIVRTGADVAEFYKWTNYSSQQSDIKDGKKADIMPTEHHNDLETYLALCEERGITPRFNQWRENPNYMKLVNETRRSVDETPVLQPTFNLEAAKESWNNFVEKGGYYGGWYEVDEQGFNEAVEQVASDIEAGKSARDVDYGRQDIPADYAERARKARVNKSHGNTPKLSIKAMDAPYLEAVERGDMETAQRMVMEAAKIAMPNTKVVDEDGNPKVVYHQTNASVYINRETGQNWDELDWRERMEWDERDDWDDYWEEREFNTFSRVNARTTNEFDGFFFAPDYDEYHEYGDRTIAAFVNIENPASREDYNIDSSKNNAGREERIRLQNEGYDGVIREYDGVVDEYIAFEPNQIKSANPVTYDDNGNVIPLSERFNPQKEDIRFSLIGEMGARNLDIAEEATTRLDNLAVAREMEQAGKDAKTIKMATGWERGADYFWRYEVDDVRFVNPEEWVNKKGKLTLKDIVTNADELFAAYPELKDVKIKKSTAMGNGGAYNHKDNTITISVGVLRRGLEIQNNVEGFNTSKEKIDRLMDTVINVELRGTLVHEIQHAIQHIEDFARGGNAKMVNPALSKAKVVAFEQEMINQINEKVHQYNSMSTMERRTPKGSQLRVQIQEGKKKLAKFQKEIVLGKEGYRKLAGEVEARNIEKRLGLTPEERRATLAEATEDVARDDQIFILYGMEMAEKKKIAEETVSPKDSDHPAAISSATGAKILNNLDNLAKKYQEKTNRPDTFIGDVAQALDIEMQNKPSKYGTYLTISGDLITLRLSNHGATVSEFDARNEEEAISIVIDNKYKGGANDGNAHIVEYFYDARKLRKAEGKPLVDIIKSIKQTLYSGQYVDNTGLATRIEMNERFSLRQPTTEEMADIRFALRNMVPTNEPVTFDNFYNSTAGIWAALPFSEVPTREPDYVSQRWDGFGVSSRYWYGEDDGGEYVIRESDHWSRTIKSDASVEDFKRNPYGKYASTPIASCRWALDSRNVATDEYADKNGVSYGKIYLQGLTHYEDTYARHSLRLPGYQKRFSQLTEEYNALDKNDAKALADFRARKRTLVDEYWNDFTRALGADVDARAIDSTDNPEVLRPYYDMYIERVRDGRIEGEEITFEEFVEDYNKDEDMIAGHIYDSNIIFIDMAKTDKYTTTKAFTRFFIHEYAHTIIEREVSEQELIDIWNENANTEFGKSLEDGYKDETPNELGDEVLAYTVSGIGNADIRPLLNYIEGDKKVSENDVLKVFGNVLSLNAEKAKQILKIIKNGYREKGAGAAQERAQLLEKGESQLSTWGGGRRPNGGYSAGETYIENGRRVTVLDEDFSIVEDIPEFDESPKYSLKDPIEQLRKENGIVAKSFEKENELIAEKFGTEGVGRKIEKGIFNYLADVQRLQDNLYAAGVVRSDDNDFVNKMEGVRNMVERALPQELEKYVHPLLKVISTITKKFGFDYTAISDYLAAKHSIEREDESKIQTMSTEADAVWNRERVEKIVSDFESKVPENVRELLWKGVKGIEQRTLEILKKVGVYTAADIEAIQSHNWKYYVPLQGWDTKEEELIEVNKIYDLPQSGTSSTKGKWQEHSAKGRRTKPYDPLATIVAKLHKAVYVAETNKAMHALYNLVTDATRALGTEKVSFIFKASDAYYRKTQDGYEEIDADEVTPEELESNRKLHAELRKLYNERKQTDNAATIKKIDAQIKAAKSKLTIFIKAGDMAIPKEVNISQQTTRARRVYFYMNGKRMYIQFVNPKYSTAINGQTLWKRNELDKRVAGWTRWLSQTYTSLNPEFSFVTNPIRDFRDAVITHLLDAEHGNIVGFVQYMRPNSGARSAIFRAQRGTAQPLSDKELEEYNLMNRDDRKALIRKYGEKRVYDTLFKWYADNGGVTGGGRVYSVQTVADDLKDKVEKLKKGDISTHSDVYKALSESAEITTRFATFLASLDKGESVRQAVVNGRNVSVNFNRKGAWSDKIGAYHSFFNASAQGIYKYLTLARKYPKRFVAVAMSQIALGYATCLLIDYLYDLLLPDDDGDEIQTIEIPLWERLGYTAIPFMRRNGKVHTIRIPKSITFASFSAIGVLLNELQKQRITGEEAILAAASQMMSSWTYGFSEGAPFWRAAVPTVLQPIADIMNNTDAFGREVYRTDRFNQGIPNSELGLRNVIPWMYSMTKALNKATGGNEFKSGVIDINPSVVQYIMEQYAGGFGVLARKAIEFGSSLFTDKVEFEMQNFPLLGRLTYTVEPKSWYPDYKKVQDAFGTAVFSNARNQYQAGYITEDELRQIGMRNYIFKNNDKVIKNLIDLRGNYAPSSMEYKVINREINRQRGLVVKIFEEADFNNRNSISEIIKKYDPNRSNNLTNLYKEYAK